MTVCTDVYVRPQSCDTIYIYPSQVHPFIPPTPGGGPKGGRYTYDFMGDGPIKKKKLDDDALALILIEWVRNAE
jgi:hypothetical protein